MEEWRPIKGYEGLYEVSNQGRVRSLFHKERGRWGNMKSHPGKVLKPYSQKSRGGYIRIFMSKNNISSRALVHRLVANAFIPNLEDKPHVNHIDNNPGNNNIANLEWCTQKENMTHARNQNRMKFSYGSANPSAKITETDVITIHQLTRNGMGRSEIARKYGVSHSLISDIVYGKVWKHVTAIEDKII